MAGRSAGLPSACDRGFGYESNREKASSLGRRRFDQSVPSQTTLNLFKNTGNWLKFDRMVLELSFSESDKTPHRDRESISQVHSINPNSGYNRL
jgi:hypothetical protein